MGSRSYVKVIVEQGRGLWPDPAVRICPGPTATLRGPPGGRDARPQAVTWALPLLRRLGPPLSSSTSCIL